MSDEPKREPGPEDELPIEAELLGEEDVPPDEAEPEQPQVTRVESPGTELEVRPASDQVLMPLDTTQVVEGMKAYQKLLHDLLEPSDWQGTGDDKFLKKSGWRKIARAFNLSLTKVSITVERDAEGNPVRAEAVFRALAPNGQVQDGDGYCSVDEPRFASAKGRQKIENDLRATATTRAKNRAISDLVGMGEVSAEEVDAAGGSGWSPANDHQRSILSNALTWLFEGDATEAEKTWNMVRSALGVDHIPGPVADAITAVIATRKKFGEAKAAAGREDKPPEGAPPETSDPS